MVIVKFPSILVFEWDQGNERKNWLKHRITAEEAEEPFFSDDYLVLDDKIHSSKGEIRNILIGKSNSGKILFVAYTIRAAKIRIISARKADRKEVLIYEKALELTGV